MNNSEACAKFLSIMVVQWRVRCRSSSNPERKQICEDNSTLLADLHRFVIAQDWAASANTYLLLPDDVQTHIQQGFQTLSMFASFCTVEPAGQEAQDGQE